MTSTNSITPLSTSSRRRRLKLRSSIRIAVAMVALAGPLVLVGTGTAHAGALGCSWWGTFTVKGVPFAQGQYCVRVDGGGTFVAGLQGGYTSAGHLCHTNITAEFFDRNWRWYKTYSAPQEPGCSRSRTQYIHIAGNMRPGFICSTLKSGSVRVTSRCFAIT